jgi:hypothetical protein
MSLGCLPSLGFVLVLVDVSFWSTTVLKGVSCVCRFHNLLCLWWMSLLGDSSGSWTMFRKAETASASRWGGHNPYGNHAGQAGRSTNNNSCIVLVVMYTTYRKVGIVPAPTVYTGRYIPCCNHAGQAVDVRTIMS